MDLTHLHLHWGQSNYKGKNYRSYSLAREFRQDGKSRKEIVLKLGKLSDEEAAKWRNLLEALKGNDSFVTTLNDIVAREMTRAEFNMSAPNAIGTYREKVAIEVAFRDIKSFVEVAPVHVWTEAHLKAHFTICILSHLINRILTLSLHKNPGESTRKIVSHGKLFAELSDCMIDRIEVENVHLSTYNMTGATPEQRELYGFH